MLKNTTILICICTFAMSGCATMKDSLITGFTTGAAVGAAGVFFLP